MPRGKYRSRYCKEIIEYFGGFNEKGIPQLSKFARKVGVTLRTLENWKEKYPKFHDACEECIAIRDEILIDGGLMGRYNPQITKFILENAKKKDEAVEIEVKIGGDGGNELAE